MRLHGPTLPPQDLVPWRIEEKIKTGRCTPELLDRCLKHGCLDSLRQLLSAGATVTEHTLLQAVKVAPGLLSLLLSYSSSSEMTVRALLRLAVELGSSQAALPILKAYPFLLELDGVSHLASSIEAGHPNMCRVLLSAGVDANSEAGQLFCRACQIADVGVVRDFILFGADTTCLNDQPTRNVVARKSTTMLTLLLHNGGNPDLLVCMPETLERSYQKMALSATRIARLRAAFSCSVKKLDFKWQILACPGKLTFTGQRQLRYQANHFDIPAHLTDKRELCALLAKASYGARDHAGHAGDEVDLVGDPISSLPAWQVFRCCGRPHNVFDLFKIIDAGKRTDPFRFELLPMEELARRREFLRKTLIPCRFAQKDLLKDVALTPIPSPRASLRATLMEEVWDKIPYPPSAQLILDATDEDLDRMVHKLCVLTSGSRPYTLINSRRTGVILSLRGARKKAAFVRLIGDVLAIQDDWTSTRSELVGILMRHCSSAGGSSSEEDLYDFMLQEEPLDEMEWYGSEF